jgi:hypothetical protein
VSIIYRLLAPLLVALLFSGLLLERARAGDGHFFAPVVDPVVREECGGCHLAFAPSLLPANSWKRMMADLTDHFGSDAGLDAATTERIAAYLADNAADSGGQRYGRKMTRGLAAQEAPLRITELPRWVRIHHEVSSWEWSSKKVGSKSNCAACHTDAERGYFDD